MAKREMAVHTRCTPTRIVKGKWETETTHFTVEVMARASGYAMVRRKGCMPFVSSEKDLSPYTAGTQAEHPAPGGTKGGE